MCYLIAEIGFNHAGDLARAAEMIKAAAAAGADAVKFQTFRAGDILLPQSPCYDGLIAAEMTLEQHRELANIAADCGVAFLSTPFSKWAVEVLEQVGVVAYKVASMDCTNPDLLRLVAQTGKPIYLSTGMATLPEIAETMNVLNDAGSGPVTLLHCVSKYPAEAGQLNLAIIPLLRDMFNTPVGYSDHYPGTQACLAAFMLGAGVIETHFTLDVHQSGGDHSHSADPAMLKQLRDDMRLFADMRGSARAIYDRPDRAEAALFRRGIYAAADLAAGTKLEERHLMAVRPLSSLTPADLPWLIGGMVRDDVAAGQAIARDMIVGSAEK